MIEAVSCAGFYGMVGFVLNAFEVPPQPGGEFSLKRERQDAASKHRRFRIFQHCAAAPGQRDGAAPVVLGVHETVDNRVFPHRNVRTAVPGFHGLFARARPIRHPGREIAS